MTPRERADALAERCTWCGVSLCDHCQRDVERAIESALAEQAAGEIERLRTAAADAHADVVAWLMRQGWVIASNAINRGAHVGAAKGGERG